LPHRVRLIDSELRRSLIVATRALGLGSLNERDMVAGPLVAC
jgi:hypothetical protein